jgi:putative membrane protein
MKISHMAVLALLPLAACASNPPPPAPMAMPVQPTVSAQDTAFATAMAGSDMFEIQASQMALTKSPNPRVRAFAQRMIDDHTKTTQQMMALAQGKSIALPTALGLPMQQKLDVLQAASRRTFDREYDSQQVAAHKMAVQTLQTEIGAGTDPDLKMFAQNTLPIIQDHLKMATALRGR